jgi:ATP-binding cassette subfamily F protein 3
VALLNTSNLTFSYAGEPILEDITLKIEPGARVGIIGRNGSGKSTLLNLFDDRLEPNRGSVRKAPGTRVSFQTQELDAPMDRTVIQTMRDVFQEDFARDARLRELEVLMADSRHAGHPGEFRQPRAGTRHVRVVRPRCGGRVRPPSSSSSGFLVAI